jgi:hypothetical protein
MTKFSALGHVVWRMHTSEAHSDTENLLTMRWKKVEGFSNDVSSDDEFSNKGLFLRQEEKEKRDAASGPHGGGWERRGRASRVQASCATVGHADELLLGPGSSWRDCSRVCGCHACEVRMCEVLVCVGVSVCARASAVRVLSLSLRPIQWHSSSATATRVLPSHGAHTCNLSQWRV